VRVQGFGGKVGGKEISCKTKTEIGWDRNGR
jgi:hypothetical protein